MVGDLDAVDRDAAAFAVASAGLRLPARAFATRLIQAEAGRRRGRTPARSALEALRRLAMTMPPALKARWELFSALLSDPGKGRVAIERLAAAKGLPALSLLAKPVQMLPGGDFATRGLVEEIVAILHLCQAAQDETEVLGEVCSRVRRHLDAVAAALVVRGAAGLEVIAFDGQKVNVDIAERAMTAAITIGPCQRQGRIESGAPVRYGGQIIGALSAVWTLGSADDVSHAGAVLSTTAAAVAPVLWAAVAASSGDKCGVRPSPVELLGVTPSVVELRRQIERAAVAPFAVLIEGESGSGKELVARAVHRAGPRRERPFCTLNCAALPDDLIEAELFGHARGAFTGALTERPGIFEEAHGGTLLLDEVGELSPRAQAKLLRTIQEGELRRLGENVARRVDVRIVSATNRDLRREVEAGRFRRDLMYRLDVIRITVPPLRERRDDVALLVDHFWADSTRRIGSRALLSAAARDRLGTYDWPGNVRELQNVLASLAVRSPKRGVVPPTALPTLFAGPALDQDRREANLRLEAARRIFEERFVRAALARTGGHRGRAASELGMTRQGLTKLMARLGIRQN
jgi:transcriptional regulator with PAS, ATPase and Fis domain